MGMNDIVRRGQFQPGQSGNPAGKPLGAKNRLSRRLVEDLETVWNDGGIDALRILKAEKPDVFLRIAFSTLPADILMRVEHELPASAFAHLSPADKRALAEVLLLMGQIGTERATALLRSEAAKLVVQVQDDHGGE
jgi:hypothetical protein